MAQDRSPSWQIQLETLLSSVTKSREPYSKALHLVMSKTTNGRDYVTEVGYSYEREDHTADTRSKVDEEKDQNHDDATDLKTADDGHTILVPQPTDDPDDPLNWSRLRKHGLLLIISYTAFLPDSGSAIGAIALVPQSE
ncbi:MAG: hypothetical protein Q9170_001022 [Blastenia crenularia]